MQIKKYLVSRIIFAGLFSTVVARADISAFVLDSEGVADHVTNGGHSVLVLSDICADSPIKLRLCTDSDSERGVVINKMQHLSKENYNWIATPTNEYLYGSASAGEAPLVVNKEISDDTIQKRYNAFYSESIQSGADKGRWTKSVGALFIRTVYEYRLPGFLEEEIAIMNLLNDGPNKSDYNVILNNCADFVGKSLKTFLHTSLALSVDGGGIHSPKAIAMNLTQLGIKDPSLNMQVIKYTQLSGTAKRSTSVMAPSENLYKNPIFAVPIGILAPEIPAVAFLLNEVFKKFHQESAYQKSLTPEQRARILGTPEEWKTYKTEFQALIERARNDSSLPAEIRAILVKTKNDKDIPRKLMSYFGTHGQFSLKDDSIQMTLQIQGEPTARVAGMTRETVATADRQIGYLVMLADLGQTLYEPARVRSSMDDFKKDWVLLQSLGQDNSRSPASSGISDELYEKLFPYYTTQCAVGQMVKKKIAPGSIGGEYGHSLLYIKGACRDTSACGPLLKMCDGTKGGAEGAIVSLDSIYLNTSFIVLDGKDMLFNAGLGTDQTLTQEYFDQVVAKALKSGAAHGVKLTDGSSDENAVARKSTQTDWAISFARDAACVNIPLNRKQVETMIDSLNKENDQYLSGKNIFEWNEFTNNCVTLIRSVLADIGIREDVEKPHGVFKKLQEFKEAKKSELPIPAMDLVQTVEAVNRVEQIDTAENIFGNEALRDYFDKFGTLAAFSGGTVEFVPMHETDNDLYVHGAKMIFDKLTKDTNETKWKAFLSDPQYSTVAGNLSRILDRLKSVRMQRKSGTDPLSELGKFASKYDRWVDHSIIEIQSKLELINSAQASAPENSK